MLLGLLQLLRAPSARAAGRAVRVRRLRLRGAGDRSEAHLLRSSSSLLFTGSLPPSKTHTGVMPCLRSSSTCLRKYVTYLRSAASRRHRVSARALRQAGAQGANALVCRHSHAQVLGAGVQAAVEPDVGVHRHALAGKLLQVCVAAHALQARQQAGYPPAAWTPLGRKLGPPAQTGPWATG